MANTRKVSISRCEQDSCSQMQDSVVREMSLRILLIDSLGEEDFAIIHTLPDEPRALIIGLLFTSRLISQPSDVLQVIVKNRLAKVRLADACDLHTKVTDLKPTARLVSGICGPEESAIGVWRACDLPAVKTSYFIPPAIIRKAILRLGEAMQLYQTTGGTHGAALADQDGHLMVHAEDIGRHNAVDRVIGKGLERKIDLSTSFLVSSGRLTSDLVLKVAVAQIPILASISAAVDSGIELADAAGITLIGFVRGTRMNVYTHPSRLTTITG